MTDQISDQERANLPKSFHDDALNITYFYPNHFAPVTDRQDKEVNAVAENCVQTTLTAKSAIPAGPSSFVLTMIDNTCPDALREATSLGPFTRMQLLASSSNMATRPSAASQLATRSMGAPPPSPWPLFPVLLTNLTAPKRFTRPRPVLWVVFRAGGIRSLTPQTPPAAFFASTSAQRTAISSA